MDLDDAADQLYAGPPEAFVERRTALVKQARQAKDKALATAIGGLRKPTRTAWLVNLLARSEADLPGLLDLGPALREAQTARDGDALRTLSTQRRRAIDALTRRATALAREQGHPPSEATVAEVAATLQAALGDPEVTELVRRGRLAAGAVYGGFGLPADASGTAAPAEPTDLMTALAASMAAREVPVDDEVGRRRRAALQQALDAALARRDETRAAREEAEAAAEQSTERADDLAEQVERLRTELDSTQGAERTARDEARAAREHLRERRDAADQADAAWREADAALHAAAKA